MFRVRMLTRTHTPLTRLVQKRLAEDLVVSTVNSSRPLDSYERSSLLLKIE